MAVRPVNVDRLVGRKVQTLHDIKKLHYIQKKKRKPLQAVLSTADISFNVI